MRPFAVGRQRRRRRHLSIGVAGESQRAVGVDVDVQRAGSPGVGADQHVLVDAGRQRVEPKPGFNGDVGERCLDGGVDEIARPVQFQHRPERRDRRAMPDLGRRIDPGLRAGGLADQGAVVDADAVDGRRACAVVEFPVGDQLRWCVRRIVFGGQVGGDLGGRAGDVPGADIGDLAFVRTARDGRCFAEADDRPGHTGDGRRHRGRSFRDAVYEDRQVVRPDSAVIGDRDMVPFAKQVCRSCRAGNICQISL